MPPWTASYRQPPTISNTHQLSTFTISFQTHLVPAQTAILTVLVDQSPPLNSDLQNTELTTRYMIPGKVVNNVNVLGSLPLLAILA
jgi:hypothetical protein